MKFILQASSADLCQPDLVKSRLGPLWVIKFFSKIQENAYFVGFKKILLPGCCVNFKLGYLFLICNHEIEYYIWYVCVHVHYVDRFNYLCGAHTTPNVTITGSAKHACMHVISNKCTPFIAGALNLFSSCSLLMMLYCIILPRLYGKARYYVIGQAWQGACIDWGTLVYIGAYICGGTNL